MKYVAYTRVEQEGKKPLEIPIGTGEDAGNGGIEVKLDAIPVNGVLIVRPTEGGKNAQEVHVVNGCFIRNFVMIQSKTDGQNEFECEVLVYEKWAPCKVGDASSSAPSPSGGRVYLPFGHYSLKHLWEEITKKA